MSSHPNSTRLYLIRHGEVESKYHKVFGGSRIDMQLSDEGHQQALRMAEYLHTERLDAIYCSPMTRAQQTLAPLLAKVPHHQPRILDGLREVDFGAWTGLNWNDVQEKFGISAFDWLDQLHAAAIPEAESAMQFRLRVEPCLQQIIEGHKGQHVAVVCHGGVIRMLLSVLLDIPLTTLGRVQIEYAGLSVVNLHAHKTELQLLNFTPWRDHR